MKLNVSKVGTENTFTSYTLSADGIVQGKWSTVKIKASELGLKAGDVIGNMRGRQEQYSIGFFGMLNNYMLYWFGRDAESRPELSEGQAHELVHQFLYGIYV